MSTFRSEAPVWFREQLARWLRNFGKLKGLSEHEVHDWWVNLKHLDEEQVCRVVDSVLNDESVQKFPLWSQVRKRIGGDHRARIDAVDLGRMMVWSIDGAWIGSMDGLTFEHRTEIARYVAQNLFPKSGLSSSQVRFIKELDPAIYELLKTNDWRLPVVTK